MTDDNQKRTLVWLITGCSSGLGRAFAHAVLAKGDRVAATTRQVESIESFQKDYSDFRS